MKKECKQDGIIYKVENIENGKIYIGATLDKLQRRKSDHLCKARSNRNNHEFQEAISTFGAEAFEWHQIDTASNLNELATKEKEYIFINNSKDNGYNSDNGGGFNKQVYQYSLDGKLVEKHASLETAGESINTSGKAISKTCLSVNQTLHGFYWSYEYSEPYIPNSDRRKKDVYQYDLEGNFIAKYKSVSQASKQTEVNKTSIAKVCRGERNHAGGHIWVYE